MMPRHKPECRAKTMVSCLHDQGHTEELYNRNTAVLLYPLKYWSLCNQTSLMVHHYKPEKNWLLSSSSRSQQGLKSSLNVCQSYIFCPIALQSNCVFWLLITTSSADNVGILILTITLTYSITRNTTGGTSFARQQNVFFSFYVEPVSFWWCQHCEILRIVGNVENRLMYYSLASSRNHFLEIK